MGKTRMLPSPFQSISSSYVICCSVCLFLNKQRISGWKRQFSRCGLVIPYLKSAFLCGFQWVPFRRIQELEGENVMQKFAINCHSDPTQTQRTSVRREGERTKLVTRAGNSISDLWWFFWLLKSWRAKY